MQTVERMKNNKHSPGPLTGCEAIYADICSQFGTDDVPWFYQAMGAVPDYLSASWARYRVVMTDGDARREDKEFVGLATAIAQGCESIVAFQQDRLGQMGVTAAAVVEALAVTDFFEGFDAFAHTLHVDSDLRPRRLMAGDMALIDKEIDVNVPYILESDDATVNRVYDEIKQNFGIPFIPNIFKALAHYPDALEAKWEAYKAIMLRGELQRLTKELIAVAVSGVNACFY